MPCPYGRCLWFKKISEKEYTVCRGQVLPESLLPADHFSIKPAPTGILFARNLLSLLHRNTAYTDTIYGELIAAARLAWTNPW
jgi:hypothetical protein